MQKRWNVSYVEKLLPNPKTKKSPGGLRSYRGRAALNLIMTPSVETVELESWHMAELVYFVTVIFKSQKIPGGCGGMVYATGLKPVVEGHKGSSPFTPIAVKSPCIVKPIKGEIQ